MKAVKIKERLRKNKIAIVGILVGLPLIFSGLWVFLLKDLIYDPGPFELIIKNGTVIDGLGNKGFKADVGIRNGKIIAVGLLNDEAADRILDAEGQIVAPGFIDVHTHIENNLPGNSAPFLAPNFIRQGVTTIITGNCGSSVQKVETLFRLLEKNGSQVNVATFVGHNTIRRKVMKNADREPTADELQKMKILAEEAMRNGAIGLSTGLAYTPGSYAGKNEVVALARVAAAYKGIYVSHIRDEGRQGIEAIKEALEIGKGANLPVNLSHFKISGKRQWDTSGERLRLVQQALDEGQQVTLDQYPYTASSTSLQLMIPSWALAGDESKVKERIQNPKTRARIVSEMVEKLRANGWTDYTYARIAYCSLSAAFQGLTIPQAAALKDELAQYGKTRKPAANPPAANARISFQGLQAGLMQATGGQAGQPLAGEPAGTAPGSLAQQINFILYLALHGGAQMIYFDMNDSDVLNILRHPDTMIGSDSAVRNENMESVPHPRGMGTFPRILARYVREQQIFPLEEALRRMTSLPAAVYGLTNRGQIKKGFYADIVIFNEQRIADQATYDAPLTRPEGIVAVLVNGEVVLENQHLTSALAGKSLKHDQGDQ
jgi:N-acyl-D-amino-acid deacylase